MNEDKAKVIAALREAYVHLCELIACDMSVSICERQAWIDAHIHVNFALTYLGEDSEAIERGYAND